MKKILLLLLAASTFLNIYGMDDKSGTTSAQEMQLIVPKQILEPGAKDKPNPAPKPIKKNPAEIITKGTEDEIIELLENGFDPKTIINHNFFDGKGTVLHWAARRGLVRIFNYIRAKHPEIDLNLAIDVGPWRGWRPLRIAAQYEQTKIVDLLFSLLKRPQQCCYLTVEQYDSTGAMAHCLHKMLIANVISIVTPHVIQKTFEKYPLIKEFCESGKFTVLASSPANLFVIIPESLSDFGIIIPESEKQKEPPSVDITAITEKYGLKNLQLMNPHLINRIINKSQKIRDENINELINLFESIINHESDNRPTCFYLDGHGWPPGYYFGRPGGHIAAIPTFFINNFLSALVRIRAQLLYTSSCYEAGTNLFVIQNAINNIITKQITAGVKPSIINYAIILEATSGTPEKCTADFRTLFLNLKEFLKEPSWALEFARKDDAPPITMSDVIVSALYFKDSTGLHSIRLPGKTSYFRSLDIGNMEIITTSRIMEAGVAKTIELLAQSKSPDKATADEAKKTLQKPLEIKIPIKPDVQFIQIFPTDLTDFKFEIQGSSMPKFISKQPGQGHHFIGQMSYTSNEKDKASALKEFINDGFVNVFDEGPAESPQCWFIRSVELIAVDKTYVIHNLAVKLRPSSKIFTKCAFVASYAYINENGECIFSKDGVSQSKVDKKTFESTIKSWFESTKPSQETLTEATGGVEITAEEKEKLIKGQSSNSQLINPQYQRTSDDLFITHPHCGWLNG